MLSLKIRYASRMNNRILNSAPNLPIITEKRNFEKKNAGLTYFCAIFHCFPRQKKPFSEEKKCLNFNIWLKRSLTRLLFENSKFRFYQNFDFSSKFGFLIEISFLPKFRFFIKISIFDRNFVLTKILIFHQDFDF